MDRRSKKDRIFDLLMLGNSKAGCTVNEKSLDVIQNGNDFLVEKSLNLVKWV